MYYQFSNFTGRLIGASHVTHPYYPISPASLHKREPPKITYDSPHVKFAKENVPTRTMASQKVIPGTNMTYAEVPEKLRQKMERFQINDGVLVHFKGGPLDRILFGVTAVLCVVGIGGTLQLIYEMSFPKKA